MPEISPGTNQYLHSVKRQLSTFLDGDNVVLQLSFAVFALTLALLFSLLMRSYAERKIERFSIPPILKSLLRSTLQLIAPVLTIVFIAIAKPFVYLDETPAPLLRDATALSVAWLIALVLGMIIHNRAVARLVVVIVFLLAFLSITNLLEPTSKYLDSFAFAVGNFKLSLLVLLKGLALLAILIWLANFLSRTVDSTLRRNPNLSYSSRELITKLFNIFIYLVAILAALEVVGIDLTALTVFGGALGVGIGFGLQKITGNFISGLILLFERSIRVGDLVELDTMSGIVKHMAVRYTILEMPNGKEVIVPNEDLIVSRVINQTFTNMNARIEITVSVSYESDAVLAKQLMLEAATEHERCLKDPSPSCTLQVLGSDGLEFLLLFWVEDVTEGLFAPKSDVQFAILEKFKANNIVIPYPQRDIRILHGNVTVQQPASE